MHFQKEDLSSYHYNWDELPDKQVFSGSPSRRLFDRFNGRQVLFMINLYAMISDKFTIEEGRRVEEKIINELPIEVKSEVSVFNWLIAAIDKKNV